MLVQFVLGFLVLVAASYVGTTMALREFFGREYFDPSDRNGSDDPPRPESPREEESRRCDDRPRTDDVPRASDVSGDESEDG